MKFTRNDFKPLILEALREYKGKAKIFEICKFIWDNYHHKISKSEKLLYTWQYEIRWAGQQLQKEGKLKKGKNEFRGIWSLTS